MQSPGSIEINGPIDEVFRLTTEHVAEWSDVVKSEEVLERTPDGIASRVRIVTADRGQEMVFDGTITAHDPPRRSVISMVGKAFDIVAEYTFEETPGGTRVTQVSHVSGKGLVWLIFFLFGWLMKKQGCKAAQREMENLKRF